MIVVILFRLIILNLNIFTCIGSKHISLGKAVSWLRLKSKKFKHCKLLIESGMSLMALWQHWSRSKKWKSVTSSGSSLNRFLERSEKKNINLHVKNNCFNLIIQQVLIGVSSSIKNWEKSRNVNCCFSDFCMFDQCWVLVDLFFKGKTMNGLLMILSLQSVKAI